jgi:hypothetical protein
VCCTGKNRLCARVSTESVRACDTGTLEWETCVNRNGQVGRLPAKMRHAITLVMVRIGIVHPVHKTTPVDLHQ